MITLITGVKNSGKTQYIEDWYRKEPKGAGCFAQKVYADGHWIGYDLKLIPNGDTLPYIRLIPYRDLLEGHELHLHNRFVFSKSAFKSAADWLEIAVTEGIEPIWIDEVGNMEMGGEGYDFIIYKGIAKGLDMRMVFRYQHFERLIEHYRITDYHVINCNHQKYDTEK